MLILPCISFLNLYQKQLQNLIALRKKLERGTLLLTKDTLHFVDKSQLEALKSTSLVHWKIKGFDWEDKAFVREKIIDEELVKGIPFWKIQKTS